MERGTAIVTGAGGALGRATALRLGRDGFAVGVLDHVDEALVETLELLAREELPAHAMAVDLRDAEAIQDAFSEAERQLDKPLTALINNAAIYPSGACLEIPVQ